MKTLFTQLRTRAALWLGLAAMALSQSGCAHPVMVQPSVVVQARVGGPAYATAHGTVVYGPPPVVMAPAPIWLPPPPPVVMAPPMVLPAPYPPHAHYRPLWRGEHRGHGHGWGHRGW